MNVSPINVEAFCDSIKKALSKPPDVDGSMRRIQKTLNGLPNGQLYYSVRKDCIAFYTVADGKQRYVSKKTELIYSLARRRYLRTLQKILGLSFSDKASDVRQRKKLIAELQNFIRICDQGKLDIARIILTSQQYNWFKNDFKQKPIDEDTPFRSNGNVPVRSKSERDIANANESFAVPLHYEEQLKLYVKPLVQRLQEALRRAGKLHGKLYSYINGKIHWNVPEELQWMNASGSIWKTYDAAKGTLTIYNDFKIMLADSTIFIWEHSGLIVSFVYRCNETERVAIMKFTGAVDQDHFLETYESDIDTPEKRSDLIERYILPKLWF